MTYNPFGIEENNFKSSYKHIFPSGMCYELKMLHKVTELSVKRRNTKSDAGFKPASDCNSLKINELDFKFSVASFNRQFRKVKPIISSSS